MFLEQLKTRVTAVITLSDDLTVDQKVRGEVFLDATIKDEVVKQGDNQFVLTNAIGSISVTFGGHYYQTESTVITIPGPGILEKEFSLKPKSFYPFPENSTVLRGKVVAQSNGKPIPEAEITLQGRTEKTISEENGGYYILFQGVTTVLNINVVITKNGFQTVQIPVVSLYPERINYLQVEMTV